eukprot:7854168-Alexandrium_andersonii.AAC.1
MSASLVGSEMCIRDSAKQEHHQQRPPSEALRLAGPRGPAVPLGAGEAAARAPRHHQRGADGHVAIATGRVGRVQLGGKEVQAGHHACSKHDAHAAPHLA